MLIHHRCSIDGAQIEELKENKLIKELEFEEYGMLFHLAETNQDLLIEIMTDCQTDDKGIEVAITMFSAFLLYWTL